MRNSSTYFRFDKIFTPLFQILILLSAVICTTSVHAAEGAFPQKSPWAHEDIFWGRVVQCLSITPLAPFIKEGENANFVPVGFEKTSDKIPDTVYPIGKISQGNNSYQALFWAKRNPVSNEVQIKLLCLSKDKLPNPVLFGDIMTAISPKITQTLPYFQVLIEEVKESKYGHFPAGESLHKWTFFNNQNAKEYLIHLIPDGNGGTQFNIMVPK